MIIWQRLQILPFPIANNLIFDRRLICRTTITPAYAGKTAWKSRTFQPCKDHPRIRGKDAYPSPPIGADQGSPPHTRERLFLLQVQSHRLRITPAYAGKTIADILCKVHELGSPPHTRERPKWLLIRRNKLRITPAYAGKTSNNCLHTVRI